MTTPRDIQLEGSFSLDDKVAVVVGASGAIGRSLSTSLGRAGAALALLARRAEPLDEFVTELREHGVDARAWPCDALAPESLSMARDQIQSHWGAVDVLVNAAGGNVQSATLADDRQPFELELGSYRDVIELNLFATLAAINVFGPALAASPADDRAILNISSMAAERSMTRVGGYGAAKAAVESITRWLAIEFGRRDTKIRVNAIAPGFFIGAQNRSLLLQADGSLTERGHTIIAKTPLRRFGDPADLGSTAVWLCSPGARFVTGVVVPVDGGFSAFSGV